MRTSILAGQTRPEPSTSERPSCKRPPRGWKSLSSGRAIALPRNNRWRAVSLSDDVRHAGFANFLAPGASRRVLLQETILDLGVDRVQPLLGAFGFLSMRLELLRLEVAHATCLLADASFKRFLGR
jgi:hypothetical protein